MQIKVVGGIISGPEFPLRGRLPAQFLGFTAFNLAYRSCGKNTDSHGIFGGMLPLKGTVPST